MIFFLDSHITYYKEFSEVYLVQRRLQFQKNHLILNTREYSRIQTLIKVVLFKLPILFFNYVRDALYLYSKYTSVSMVRTQSSKGPLLLCT